MRRSDTPSATTPAFAEPPPLPKSSSSFDFDAVVTGKNLFRSGLGLVLLALAFLFRYGWQQGWITPTLQIGGAAMLSIGFVIVGDRMRDGRAVFGDMLAGGGVAGLYLTAFAAHQAFAMTEPAVAFVQLIAIAAVGVGLSLRRDSVVLAGVSVAGAFVAPFLIGGTIAGGTGDVAYLGLVMASAVGLAFVKEWPSLYGVAAVGATVVGLFDVGLSMIGGETVSGSPTAFAVATYAVVALAPMVAALVMRTGDRLVTGSAAVMAVVAGAFYAVHVEASPGVRAVVAAGAAAVHGAFYAFAGDRSIGEVHLIPAGVFGLAAVATLFDGNVTALAAAAAGAGLVVIGLRSQRHLLAAGGGSVLGIASLWVIGGSLLDAGDTGSLGEILARFGVFGVGAGLAVWLHRTAEDQLAAIAGASAYAGTMALTFTELATINVGLVTAVWAMVGMGLVIVGRIAGTRQVLMTGLITVALTIGKLFLVDLATVDAVWRISLFAGLGLGLLAVGYWIARDET